MEAPHRLTLQLTVCATGVTEPAVELHQAKLTLPAVGHAQGTSDGLAGAAFGVTVILSDVITPGAETVTVVPQLVAVTAAVDITAVPLASGVAVGAVVPVKLYKIPATPPGPNWLLE